MKRVAVIGASLLAFGCLLDTASAAALDLKAVNEATFGARQAKAKGKAIDPVTIKVQVLLDRARFSPGVIDGRGGENMRNALAAFKASQGLKADPTLNEETWTKLSGTSSEPVVMEYTISSEDAKGPFLEKIPSKMEDMVGLDRLGYTSPLEMLAEKFHMDEDLLKALNPGKSFDKAGTAILVAKVGEEKPSGKVAKIEVDKGKKALRAFDKDGKMLAAYPASIGSAEKPAPIGTHKVQAVAENPTYTYNPDFKFKGVKAKETFSIKGGPNNPVGAVWIDLSLDTYGIHGTPEPAKVGKSYSHGCVRLTNWDVKQLAQMVEKGTAVEFVN